MENKQYKIVLCGPIMGLLAGQSDTEKAAAQIARDSRQPCTIRRYGKAIAFYSPATGLQWNFD